MTATVNSTPTIKQPAAVSAIWADTLALGFSMASEPLTGNLLRSMAASKPGARFLELGTGTGLSTAWLLGGMNANASLISMDNDAKALAVARQHLGADTRLQLVCAEGDDFVHSLYGQRFDFIFADTWAGKYRLLDETLALLSPGGVYVVDDMLPQPNWPEGHDTKAAHLKTYLAQREDFMVCPLDWASGIILASKISKIWL